MNIKITVTTLIAIFVAILIFYFIMNWYPSNFDPVYTWTEHVKNKSNNPKILLFGSSHTGVLNTDVIQEHLKNNGFEHEVYNLATPSDYPTRRAGTIGYIAELNPDIVFYGIEIRMFEGQASVKKEQLTALQISEINNILPSSKEFFEDVVFPFTDNEFFAKIPKSPKIVTLQTVKHFVRNTNQTMELDIDSNRPFFNTKKEVGPIIDLKELQIDLEKRNPKFYGIDPNTNREFDALKELIKELENKDIKVVIFATPKSNVYLNWLDEEDKQIFDEMLTEISNSEISVYKQYDKYADLNIWTDIVHIVENESGIVYSNDIAKIVLKELNE